MGLRYIWVAIVVGSLSITSLFADANTGAKLFDGSISFKNGGPACVHCHNVSDDRVISGGALAKDLTKIISSYGGAEAGGPVLKAMLQKASDMPSPVMVKAYKGSELTDKEINNLVDFFVNADEKNENISNSSAGFIISALIGAVILLILLVRFGGKRKALSVNQKLYDRQLKSTWRS